MAKITGSAEQRGCVHTCLSPVSEHCLDEGWRSSSMVKSLIPWGDQPLGRRLLTGKELVPL